jgi:3,4-dehydroadipyl-CoA semialdehyde dehydrogenase
MKRLSSYLEDQWVEGSGSDRDIHDAVTGDVMAQVSTAGLNLGPALDYARKVGGPSLAALSFAERGKILKQLSGIIVEARDELMQLSCENYGATRRDAKFDIDGASGTLSYYAYIGKKLGDRTFLLDGEAENVLTSKRFIGQHMSFSRRGAAVHINAFNFPCWGMAEKLATAIIAGVPVFSKPATATSPVATRLAELWVESGAFPKGSFSFLAGSVGDLLDHVGPQDCIAFTGSGAVGRAVRSHPAVVQNNARVNVEADSLNASIVGPDIEPGSDTWYMFINDIARDFTQKAGQKCTCVRRIFVPENLAEAAIENLSERLAGLTVGEPSERATDIGPLSTPGQRRDYEAGIAELEQACERVWKGEQLDKGCFVAPQLFRSDKGADTAFVHEHEVFGPVATVLTYSGEVADLAEMVAAGGGGLVASLYSNDHRWAGHALTELAPWHGRMVWGSRKVHDQSPGPGTVLPNFIHGGPGKAGGGEELGGKRGLAFYMQRTAIQADKGLFERAFGLRD